MRLDGFPRFLLSIGTKNNFTLMHDTQSQQNANEQKCTFVLQTKCD